MITYGYTAETWQPAGVNANATVQAIDS